MNRSVRIRSTAADQSPTAGAVSKPRSNARNIANRSSLPQDAAKRRGPLGFRLLAASAVAAAGAGVVLPLVPTTPFLLVALWAASRGSPELVERIRADPRFGPTLHDWEHHRAIGLKAKRAAMVVMASSWLMLWLGGASTPILILVTLILVGVAVFLLTRPTAIVRDS